MNVIFQEKGRSLYGFDGLISIEEADLLNWSKTAATDS